MKTQRYHSLDAVRAFALLCGIVLHAAMTFMPGMAGFGFPVDSSQSPALQITFYVIHIFRMTLFFVIAGFFARMLFHRKGAAEFIRDRVKRILVPLIVGWVFFGPLAMVLVYIAFAPASATINAQEVKGFPLAHLWFLYYLILLYVTVMMLRGVFTRFIDRDRRVRNAVDKILSGAVRYQVAPLVLALPVTASLYLTPNWIMWNGIASPDIGLLPQWSAMVCFGTAFAFGWLLQRQSDLLSIWTRRWVPHLILAVGFTALSYWLVSSEANPLAMDADIKIAYAATYALAIWNWIFGILGAAMRFFAGESAVRRYLADASYWMYLAHLPLVFALQLVVLEWPLHWSIKFPSILAVATGLLLLSYHFCVRNTIIGEMLNGRKYSKKHKAESADEISAYEQSATAKLVAELVGIRKCHGNVVALDGLDLQIRQGELLALLGPNGAGKSTTIACLLGQQDPDAGTVSVFGRSSRALETRRRYGVMLQDVELPPELRVAELIDLSRSYYPAPLSIEDVLRITGITALAKRPYGKLSGGQKRLVQFAIAICGRPKLIFLDEPTVGMDLTARKMLWQTLRRLIGDGCSIVLTTHYLEEAEALADRVVVLAKGKVIAEGTVDDIRARVSHTPISCITSIRSDIVSEWPGVISVSRDGQRLHLTTSNADQFVRRLTREDPDFSDLEIGRAGLAEAFTEITQEVA